MKKKMKGLLMGTACMLALAGCGGSGGAAGNKAELPAEEYVQNAHAMLEEADSFAADFFAAVDMGGNNETKTEGTVVLIKEPLMAQVHTKMDFDNALRKSTSEESIYLEEVDGVVSQYMNYDGQWTEMTMEKDSALTMVQIYNTLYNMETVFTAAENWSAEQNDGEIILSGVIPEEKFYDVEEYTRWFQLIGMSGLSEVYYAGVGDVPVTVSLDAKSGAPRSYSIDLAHALETVTNNVLKELNGGESGDGIAVKEYQITSVLTAIGGVELDSLSDFVKKDAVNYEEEFSLMAEEE